MITISREFGSGGRTIGKMVAEKLGIPCYDADLINKIAEESGLASEQGGSTIYAAIDGDNSKMRHLIKMRYSNWFQKSINASSIEYSRQMRKYGFL